MPLYEIAIIHEEYEDNDKTYDEELFYGPVPIVAADQQNAAILAVIGLNDDIKNKLNRKRMRVLVRPF